VHVYTSSIDGAADLDVPLGSPVNLDGVLVHYFPVQYVRRLCWCPALGTALARAIRGFDVVHLHSLFQWPTWAAARIAARASVPYVLSPRGMLGSEVIRRKSRWVKSAWIRLIEQRTIAESAALHVTAELEREEVEALGLCLPRIQCIANGVAWPAAHSHLSAGPYASLAQPYALFLSRIDPKKGLDRLIEAWKWVPDLKLVIAGNDENGYQRKLESIAHSFGIRHRVEFVGNVADEHKWALYERAMMFILPSYSENFGNVVAEAMAMGCPVIVTPEVGLARLVRASESGLVTDGAPRALANAIRSLLQDPATRRLMGEKGRLTAQRDLSWQSAAQHMQRLYWDINQTHPISQAHEVGRTGNP
jgi:glycosyltransferase involved in cell wall biosynthesis